MNYDDHVKELSKFDKSVIIHLLCTETRYLINFDRILKELRWAKYDYESKRCLEEMDEASEMTRKLTIENHSEYLKLHYKWSKAYERLRKVEREYARSDFGENKETSAH